MRIEFLEPGKGQPERVAGEAELHFEACDGILAGLKLVGFTLWKSSEGEVYVTMPSRAFGAGQDRRFFDYLRAVEPLTASVRTFKEAVLEAYRAHTLRAPQDHNELAAVRGRL